ncbi:hypothetical protein [Clostridium sp.]|uniref:hypothetical protein n=1 Tax=Clostridium sp. TaxID=1506 RepID=UPI00260AEEA4|nr:hypothetical protein [Clostridium sp.]
MNLQLFGNKGTSEVVEKIAKNSDEGTKAIKNSIEGVAEAKNYKYSKSVIEKAKDLYHDLPKNLDNFVLENPNVYRLDGRIEFLAKGSVNGVEGVYHITTKADMIIHRTFIPSSDWGRFSNVNGLPSLADIPALK